ncbi:uncharacterized protein LOC116132877 [Pistacia vera]|uniref:uncharacterized protein LOC116132877 n=1 Tax=Pistacia vera TaxID=55513 RepID=UPI001263DF6D|nr:uncharacterized protein LOC116132877 [Pistacia vera]
MGMDPLRSQFVQAIVVMSTMSKSEWDKKVDVYKRLHWSEEEILAAFQKHPWCMMTSEDKIMAVMDIFVNKMGWEPSAIAQRPILLSLSLEKRIIPRAAVILFLSSKGLLKTNFISATPYNICDEAFLQKFVNCYDEAPQLKKQFTIRAKLIRAKLLPKLEYFHSKGFSRPDLAKFLWSNTTILQRSLKNHLIPSFTDLTNLLQSTEKAITVVKRKPGILDRDLKINVSPKVNYLRDIGVPDSRIVMSLHTWPSIFEMHFNRFQEIVDLVKKMGINPLRLLFVKAIVTVSMMSKSEWDKKVDVYKRLHWSEEEILAAFQKNPWCMMTSEDKIMAVMDFFVNKMGWEPSAIAKRPILLSLSLEKRIIPRAAVVQFLSSKGLLKTSFISLTPYNMCEKTFLQKFVNCYDEGPQLKKLYKEKLDLSRKRN